MAARISVLVVFVVLFLPSKAFAQLEDLDQILRGGLADAEVLAERYLDPLGAGFGAALNNGWTTSASPHGILGFHVRVGVSAAFVPGSGKSFTLTDGDLVNLRIANPQIGASPTASGSDDAPTYILETAPFGGEPIARFSMPQGVGLGLTPAPVIQAGIGLINETSVMIRGFPAINIADYGSIGSWGIGVHHGLNQWIPGGWLLPVDFSVQAGYSRVSMNVDLDGGEDQAIEWTTNAFSANILAGRSLIFATVYGGLGFETSSSSADFRGTYSVQTDAGTVQYTDPISVSVSGANNVRALVGVRFNILMFGINAEYVMASYPTANIGIGLSLR